MLLQLENLITIKSINAVVSIPQAVSAVATKVTLGAQSRRNDVVSIPQAVSAVATKGIQNEKVYRSSNVSIPQAVSAVATLKLFYKT